jgi:hypothetical protein
LDEKIKRVEKMVSEDIRQAYEDIEKLKKEMEMMKGQIRELQLSQGK